MELFNDNATVTVDLENGGRISSLQVFGRELLVPRQPGGDPLAWGCYPMLPFAGRVRNGIIDFEGSRHQLPATMGQHAIHGYGFVSEWEQTGDREIGWQFDHPWPWAGRALQRFDLGANHLRLTMTATSEQRQPISMGWHPWFVKQLETGEQLDLDFHPTKMYELADDDIPNGRLIAPPPGPWDNCFVSAAPIGLRWGALTVDLSATTDHWVVYDQPAHATCVEPQTGPPNDVNSSPEVIGAGESATIEFTLTWDTK